MTDITREAVTTWLDETPDVSPSAARLIRALRLALDEAELERDTLRTDAYDERQELLARLGTETRLRDELQLNLSYRAREREEAERELDALRAFKLAFEQGYAYDAIKAERDAALARAEAAEGANEWIDVNDRLPTAAGNYLLRFDRGEQQVSEWLPNEDPPSFWYGDPTHWRPLLADPCAALAKEPGNGS